MSELRWILLGFGILVIAGVYFLRGRKIRLQGALGRKATRDSLTDRREPSLAADSSLQSFTRMIENEQDLPAETGAEAELGPAASPARTSEPGSPDARPAQGPQMIIVLHVAARGSQRFAGTDVVAALEYEGLKHGRFKIFHWQPDPGSEPVFSVASMVEPGSFDLENLSETTTPGLSLFLVLPGPKDAAEGFSQMLITARNLSHKLGGEVLDEHGSSLSNQTAGHIREEIIAFQLRLRALADIST